MCLACGVQHLIEELQGGSTVRTSLQFALVGIVALGMATTLSAQRAPAIPGVTGTMVTPETAKDEKKAADKVAVAIKDLVTREDKGPLSDLKPGSTVVIHYDVDKVTEGIVADVSRSDKVITVRYGNGKTEKLQLVDRPAVDAAQALKTPPQGTTKIVVYNSDETHGRIARYFTPKS
jgi:hypothetical protein